MTQTITRRIAPLQSITTDNVTSSAMNNTGGSCYLTHEEAAAYLRVSSCTLYCWVSKGRIIPLKAGTRSLYRKADLDAFLEECRQEAAQKRKRKLDS
jgi:excisionase family DNA binding protein